MTRLLAGYHAAYTADLPSIRAHGLGGRAGSQRARRPGWVFVFDNIGAAYDFAARYLLSEVVSYTGGKTQATYAPLEWLSPVILTLDLRDISLSTDPHRQPTLPGSFRLKAPLAAGRISQVTPLTQADLRDHVARHHRQIRVDPDGFVLPYLCIGPGRLLPRGSVLKPQRIALEAATDRA